MAKSVERALATLLADEQSAIDQLAASLNAEAAALKNRDIKAIEQSAKDKQQHLNAFNQQVKARMHYLTTQIEQPSQDTFESLLASLPQPARDDLATQWQNLKQDFRFVIIQTRKMGN